MSLEFNGTDITDVDFNDTALDTVYMNGVEVWSGKDPAGNQIFDTAGNHTFIAPKGYSEITICMIGGGGAGRKGGADINLGGGNAGQIKSQTVAITGGENISVAIGVGGIGSTSNTDGNNGSNSSFGSVIANGGSGGSSGSGATYLGDGNSAPSNCHGNYSDGIKNFKKYGGQAGFANGGNGGGASIDGYPGSLGSGGGGSGTRSGDGGDGYLKVSWS